MTNFILQEQNDWFEDEIKFVRHFIKPNMNVIDIGANYGLYTLTIAKIIGNTGKIWAFEPTKLTFEYLKKSITENNFDNIELIQSGLSNRIGTAKFYTSSNSELNSLSKEINIQSNNTEEISLLTLDHCMQKYKWENIDFIKLDAEGEESNILKAGVKTLSTLSPLIMFELKHGDNVNLSLIDNFIDIGYNIYRLIPKLNILVPFDHKKHFDGYLLNLFCCKDDKAEELESKGVIVKKWEEKNVTNKLLSQEYISKLPFAKEFQNPTTIIENEEYIDVLNSYIMSLDENINSNSRVGYLMNSVKKIQQMIAKNEQKIERLATFARIAIDAGERVLGVKILSEIINAHFNNINFEINNLFLPAEQSYDNIPPKSKVNEWLFSSILEQFIKKQAFSLYFSQKTIFPLFDKLSSLGFLSKDMHKRNQLIRHVTQL